jgi:hypothetical protein
MKEKWSYRYLGSVIMITLLPLYGFAQSLGMTINLATVDVAALSKSALFNYQINSSSSSTTHVTLKGQVKYKNEGHFLSYTLSIPVHPGINNAGDFMGRARIEYSSASLKEMFELFDKLPAGTLQYCVSITGAGGEGVAEGVQDCIFGKTDDIFLINLVEPEHKAKIYELNPMLTWLANSPYASSLTYRLKLVPLKKGQNAINAIRRNNPIYEEKGLTQISLNYPIYAKPLEVGNTYVWTVDAYYKDLLMGGAEPWQFTIVEDSIWITFSKDPAYIDIDRESGNYKLNAPGILKLKYVLKDVKADTLMVQLFDNSNKEIPLPKEFQIKAAVHGDNRYVLDIREHLQLKHLKHYQLRIINGSGKTYHIPFRYINPDFIK